MDMAMPDVSNLTATAILGWYAWHTAAKTIPGLVRAFREEMAGARSDYRKETEALRKEIAAERLQRHSDRLAMVEALHDLTRMLPAHGGASFGHESAELRERTA